VPLVDAGMRDAARLCRVLDRHRFALVLSSPMRRALDTARIAGFAGQVEVTGDLCEWDYGDYEGLTTPEIREREPGWTVWHGSLPGGETAQQVAARVQRVVARCEAAAGDVLLFAHGHVLRVLTAVYLGFAPSAGAAFSLATGTISVLGHEHEYPTIVRWNVPPT
jgi:probable phosphoglycerate mutase